MAATALSPLLLLLLLKSPATVAADHLGSATPDTEVSPTAGNFLVFFVALFFFAGVAFVALRRILASHCWALLRGGEAGGSAGGGGSPPLRVPEGLTREAIQAIPSYFYKDVKMHRGGSKGELECAVCLSEFEDHEGLRRLPGCRHVFHPQCLDPWLISQATCPLCRSNLKPSGTNDQRSGSDESGEPGGPLEHAITIVPGLTVRPAEPGELTADSKPANYLQVNRSDRFTLTLPKEETETRTCGCS